MTEELERLCEGCDQPISLKRLAAVPTASKCVGCLTRDGDVPLIKRHDDYIGRDGEDVVETYFKEPNQYLKYYIDKLNNSIPKPGEDYTNQVVSSQLTKALSPSVNWEMLRNGNYSLGDLDDYLKGKKKDALEEELNEQHTE